MFGEGICVLLFSDISLNGSFFCVLAYEAMTMTRTVFFVFLLIDRYKHNRVLVLLLFSSDYSREKTRTQMREREVHRYPCYLLASKERERKRLDNYVYVNAFSIEHSFI